jgi:putative phosphoribosyl transferase
MTFDSRRDAGHRLGLAVRQLHLAAPVVLALPRGGVPVGFEVAKALHAPLDLLMVRKIGAPGHEEYGIGAVIDGASPQLVLDEAAAKAVGADRDYVARQMEVALGEIERRRQAYRPRPPVALADRTVVLVDDGIATGMTVRAALEGLARVKPARVILAVPVASADVFAQLRDLCDDAVCLASPEPFLAVGFHYRDFTQTTDEEVIELLAEAQAFQRA